VRAVREILEIVVPLVLPTLLYFLWVLVMRGPDGAMAWQGMPYLWLAGAGVVLLALFLLVVTVGYGTAWHGSYVAPQYKNGRIIPGHVVPESDPRPN
jgi:hypothetical protein